MSPRVNIWTSIRAVCTLREGVAYLPCVPAMLLNKSGHSQSLIRLSKKMSKKGSSNLKPHAKAPTKGLPWAQSALCSGLLKKTKPETNKTQILSNRPDSHRGSLTRTASTPKPSEYPVSTAPCSLLFKAFCFFIFATSNCWRRAQ